MSLIDLYLSEYEFVERHSAVIPASIDQTYRTVRNFQFANSPLTLLLLRLRGFSAGQVNLQSVLNAGFILLDESDQNEFVLGLAGKFWTPGGCLQKLTPGEFINFRSPGFAKAAWNFTFEEIGEQAIRVTTETRIHCLDEQSRQKFKMYWFFIAPFSGLIRKEILRSIKKTVRHNQNTP